MPELELPDLSLHYRDLGQGEPLMLIHGLGSSGADWAFQIAPLVGHFRLLVPDLRGSGLSKATPGPYSIAGFADDLWRLLDALGLPSVRLLGFSLGGAVAIEMALQRPHAVVRLMTMNTLPSYRLDHWRKRRDLYLHLVLIHGLGLRRSARLIGKRLFPMPHQAAMRERVAHVIGGQPKRPYLDTVRALASWCALDRLQALRMPSLMLAAEHDYTPLAEKRGYAESIGAEFVVVRGSRHGTPFDSTAASNACALAFFLGQPLPDPELLVIDPPERTPQAPPPEFGLVDTA